MRKKISLILAALMLFTVLTACGADKPEATATPSPTAQATNKPSPTPKPTPTETPAPTPAPVLPTEAPAQSVDLAAFYETLAASYEMPMMMDGDGDTLDAFYPGLTGYTLSQRVVKIAAITGAVAEVALAQCGSAEDAAAVAAIFEARKQAQVDGGAWYPDSIAGWEKAVITTNGNYVALIALDDNTSDAVAAFNALFA